MHTSKVLYTNCVIHFTEYPIKPQSNGKQPFQISMLFPSVVVPTLCMAPICVVIGMSLATWDPVYFIMGELLPDRMCREAIHIYGLLAFRMLYTYLLSLEFFRLLLYLLGSLLVLIDRHETVLGICIGRVKDFDRFWYYHRCALLNFKKIEIWLNNVVYMGMSGVSWITVVLSYLIVRGDPEELTMPVYIIFVGVFVIMILVHVLVIPHVCDMAETMDLSMKVNTLRISFQCAKRPSTVNRIRRLQSKALYPFCFRYGRFWVLKKEFVPEYIEMLVARCVDIILIFET